MATVMTIQIQLFNEPGQEHVSGSVRPVAVEDIWTTFTSTVKRLKGL